MRDLGLDQQSWSAGDVRLGIVLRVLQEDYKGLSIYWSVEKRRVELASC
jgi:hypothetical protein